MKTTPRRHQQAEFDLYKGAKSRALLWYMRSGKSKAMIDLACHLAKTQSLRLAIVIAPNGVHQAWTDEQLPQHHWEDVEYGATAIDSKKVGQKNWDKMVQTGLDYTAPKGLLWLTLIKEALNVSRVRNLLYKAIQERGKTLLIVDEAQHFGNDNSQRSEHIQALAARCDYKRILTGSEADEGLEKLFAQFQILRPGALGCHSFEKFQQRYCKTVDIKIKNRNGFVVSRPKIVGYQNVDKLKSLVNDWSSRVTRADADLPPLVPMTRKFDLPPEIKKVYDAALKTGTVPLEAAPPDGSLMSRYVDGMQGLNRLGQMTSGFLYDLYGDPHEFAKNPRLDVLADFLETVPQDEQVIVWCAYQYEVDQVFQLLGGGDDVARYYGGQSEKANTQDLARFKRGSSHTLVGTPHKGGEGLELGGASVVVWFSHVTSNRLRNQASERASSRGASVALVDIVANCKSDKFLVKAYRDKSNIARLVKGKSLAEMFDA